MPAQLLNIGPSQIATPGTTGGPGFILSKGEWIAVQAYVTNALALPINGDEFKKSLGPGAPSSLADFEQLIALYQSINGHCSTWQKTTFPNTVALAGNVYDYGANKAPVYYPPILKEAQILKNDPNNADAKKALKAILDNLQQTADDYANKATAAAKEVQTFAEQTQGDKTTLVGADGKGGLIKYYNDKYGATSKDVEDLTKEIKAQQVILKAANEEYDHDVIVASTTPTYAWVWPIGTIAAAVVAGIYGDKAVKALDRARAAQQKIDDLTDKLAADANLMVAINSAEVGMNAIGQALAAALPVIQKIQGVWGGIAADLQNISRLIDTDIRQVPPIIMNLGVEEAIKAWHNVAQAANEYRVNAYVTESGGPVQSMAAWRLARRVASSRVA